MDNYSHSSRCVTDVLKTTNFRCRVSSVLNRDVKNYGKTNLFDSSEETCWNSDQGSPQWIVIDFEDAQVVTGFEIQFQGGFAGHNCCVMLTQEGNTEQWIEQFYPEDINSIQTFMLNDSAVAKCTSIKFVFSESTDFFGRIVIYKLRLLSSGGS